MYVRSEFLVNYMLPSGLNAIHGISLVYTEMKSEHPYDIYLLLRKLFPVMYLYQYVYISTGYCMSSD